MKYRLCSKCGKECVPDGGIEMSRTRWWCYQCWRKS